MSEFDFTEFGKQISKTVTDVIQSKEVKDLKENLKNSFGSTIEGVKVSVNDAVTNVNQSLQKAVPPYYAPPKRLQLPVVKKPKGKTAGILMQVFGSIGALLFGILTVLSLLVSLIPGIPIAILNGLSVAFSAPLAIFCFVGIGTAMVGNRLSGRVSRFRTYLKLLEKQAYCEMKELAATVGKKEKFVHRDLKNMTKRGWFLEGHIDEHKTCFMATNESYQQYLSAKEELRRRETEEKARIEQEQQFQTNNPQVKEITGIIEEGKNYISQIRKANDEIQGVEISLKLERLELVTGKIFDYITQKPKKLPEIRKFMSYYLPTTLKLVDAYREFDSQPVQGENITRGKAEIEETLDAINKAFEKLFDQLFQEEMLDISTDISVLSTMLNSDGLMENEFSKEDA